MGVYCVATLTGEYLTGERIGSPGSGEVLIAQLLAGYGLGWWSDSRRVRNWVRPERWHGSDSKPAALCVGPPLAKKELAVLVRFCEGDQSWIRLSGSGGWPSERPFVTTMETGLKYKPAACPVLAGLLHVCRALGWNEESHDLQGQILHDALGALDEVLPLLRESPWYDKIRRVFDVFTLAVSLRGEVHFSL